MKHPDTPEQQRQAAREGYKCVFDLAAIGLAGAAPLPLWVLLAGGAALAVRLCNGAPVLYRQARLGRSIYGS